MIDRIKNKKLSANTFKIIALVTMLIDHIGAIVLSEYLNKSGISYYRELSVVYKLLRAIGRISFPIFVFMVIEGTRYTKNIWKYMMRLFVFACISEVPYLMGKGKSVLLPSFRNVMFTLLLGVVVISVYGFINKRETIIIPLKTTLMIFFTFFVATYGMLLNVEYGAFGILAIVIGFIVRNNTEKYGNRASSIITMISICMMLSPITKMEKYCFLAIIPMLFYSGDKGKNLKWLFYIFYPVHMVFLVFIRFLIIG